MNRFKVSRLRWSLETQYKRSTSLNLDPEKSSCGRKSLSQPSISSILRKSQRQQKSNSFVHADSTLHLNMNQSPPFEPNTQKYQNSESFQSFGSYQSHDDITSQKSKSIEKQHYRQKNSEIASSVDQTKTLVQYQDSRGSDWTQSFLYDNPFDTQDPNFIQKYKKAKEIKQETFSYRSFTDSQKTQDNPQSNAEKSHIELYFISLKRVRIRTKIFNEYKKRIKNEISSKGYSSNNIQSEKTVFIQKQQVLTENEWIALEKTAINQIQKFSKEADSNIKFCRYEDAEKNMELAWVILQAIQVSEHPIKSQILRKHGLILYNQGIFEQAKSKFEMSLNEEINIESQNSVSYAHSLILLGRVQKELKMYEEAEINFKSALERLVKPTFFEIVEMTQLSENSLSVFSIYKTFRAFLLDKNLSNSSTCLHQGETAQNFKERRKLYIKTLNSLGVLFCFQDQPQKGISYFLRVFLLTLEDSCFKTRKSIKQVCDNMMNTMNNVIEHRFEMGVLLEQIKIFFPFVMCQKKIQTSEYVWMQIRLGFLIFIQGNLNYSMDLFNKALFTIHKRRFKNVLLEYETLSGIGQIEMKKGNLQLASRWMRLAVDVLVNDTHTHQRIQEYVNSKDILANIYLKMGPQKYSLALECYEECIFELEQSQSVKKNCLKAFVILQKMKFYQMSSSEQNRAKSEECFEKIVENQVLNQATYQGGLLLRYISQAYQLNGKFKDAIRNMQKSLRVMQKVDENTLKGSQVSSNVTYTLWQLGYIHIQIKDYTVSLRYYKDLMKKASIIYGEKSMTMALVRRDVGKIYLGLGKYQEAISEFQQEINIRRQFCDMRGISETKKQVGLAYKKLGKLEEALACFLESLELLEKELEKEKKMARGGVFFCECELKELRMIKQTIQGHKVQTE